MLIKKKILIVLITTFFLLFPVVEVQGATKKLNKKTLSLGVDNTYTLKLLNNKKKVTWISNKKSVAVVKKGVVTGKKAGTAIITAKAGNKRYTCKVTVKKLKLNKTSMVLQIGRNSTLKLINNSKKINWSTSNSSIATINNGVVSGKKEGTATITAKVASKKYQCKVTVRRYVLNKTSLTLAGDKTFQLKVNHYSGNVTYSSSNKNIVTISKTGILTPKGAGTTTVTALVDGTTLKCSVTITKPTIRINPNSTLKKDYKHNSKTKHYYLIRSYVEFIESFNGGTLILEKGTYNVTNTIFVPSNTTIKLENATINKSRDTGGTLSPSGSIFQFVSKKIVSKKTQLHGYGGTHDSSLIGSGVLNQNYIDGFTVIIGHAKNIKISGITFKNMFNKHFIELDATNNCTITNCTFEGYKPQIEGVATKEAVNIDTPDVNNESFNCSWSSQDKTPDNNITVSHCTFRNLACGLGTHLYSYGKRHTNIKILNNSFSNIDVMAIHMMNWTNTTMTGNTLTGNNKDYALRLDGVRHLTMKSNSFSNFKRLIKNYNDVYSARGNHPIYMYLTEDQKKLLCANNTYRNTPLSIDYTNYNENGGVVNQGVMNVKTYTIVSNGTVKSHFNSSITYNTSTTITYTYNVKWTSVTEGTGETYTNGGTYELACLKGQWVETHTEVSEEGTVVETYNYTTKKTTKDVETKEIE